MNQLRKAVIKLAHDNPPLRKHLLPILKESNIGLLRPGVSVELIPKKTKMVPEGYPEGRAVVLRKVPAGMGLGGYYLKMEGRRNEIFVPFEDVKAVINMRSVYLPKK